MDVLIMVGQVLLALSILVVIHEFGHFIAARMFGVKVEKFFLFFDVGGVKLLSFKRGETEYGIGWLPLGGYVKITGMIDESMDKSFVESEPQPHEFRAKPHWQRLIIMLGGIIMNVILGIIIFTLHTWHYGDTYIPMSEMKHGIEAYSLGKKAGFKSGDQIIAVNGDTLKSASGYVNNDLLLKDSIRYTVIRNGMVETVTTPPGFSKDLLDNSRDSFITLRTPFRVGEIMKGENAEKAGLKKGDSIVAVNGERTAYYHQFKTALFKNKGKDVTLTIKRDNVEQTLPAKINEKGELGFGLERVLATEYFGFGESFTRGCDKAWHAVWDNLRALGRLVTGHLPANKSLSGLIGIGVAFGGQWNWESFWHLTAMLSMILAFMNLLPIPALDGGHVLFLLVEMIRRKPLSYRFLEVAQMVGMILIFLLMGFAFYNDIANFIIK
jgi:regulator of sigma E protease